jgi:alpha-tubulin suppressor-like RCC1 family protein
MRANQLAILILLLPTIAATGCREACSDDEVRYGDRCVLRPDSGVFRNEDAAAEEEDGGEGDDEMDAWTGAFEEDGSVPVPGDPDDADTGVEDSGTEPSICPDAGGCHRKVVQFAYGAPGCAILDDGTLWCWGGVDGPRVPKQVGTNDGWQAVSSTDNLRNTALGAYYPGNHTCAINAGAMYCWGENYSGQLGIGSGSDVLGLDPHRVGDASDWSAVSTSAEALGGAVTCGIRTGALYCWGAGNRLTPTRIGTRTDWSSVSADPLGGCGIAAGALRCWAGGSESYDGELVSEWTDWTVVSSSLNSACGIRQGKVFCWGTNESGQLGLGAAALGTRVEVPMQVGTSTDWSAIDCALTRTCGIRGAGELYCWGALDYQSTAESFVASTSAFPKRFGEESDWIAVDVGIYGACGTKANGELRCWGWNANGELGTTRIPTRLMHEPTRVGASNDWTRIAAGAASTCGIHGGQLMCWGAQRSDAAIISQSFLPVRLGSTNDWTDVATHFAAEHACGVRGGSSTWCWGAASEGQLGTLTQTSSIEPVKAPPMSNFSVVAVGPDSSCVHDFRDGLFCWGRDWSGIAKVSEPADLAPRSWDMITTVAGIKEGRIVEWTSRTPVALSALSYDAEWTTIALSSAHSCGVRRGSLYCWGNNAQGQLGLGIGEINKIHLSPQQQVVAGQSKWTSVAVREGATCGLQTDKSLWCWGRSFLATPDNSGLVFPEPRQIHGQWETLAMGGEHTCAISADGSLWCWGLNQDGQLGQGEHWTSDPQNVEFLK